MEPTPGMNRQQRRRENRRTGPIGGTSYTLAEQWADRKRHELLRNQTTSKPHTIVLPSSLQVKAKRITLSALYEMQEIPNALLPTLQRWFDAFKAHYDDVDERNAAIGVELEADRPGYLAVVRHVWLSCVVEPEFVEIEVTYPDPENPDASPRTVKEIRLRGNEDLPGVDELDMLYLFDWAQGVDQSIAAWFLARQAPRVDDLSAMREMELGTGGTDRRGDAPESVAGLPGQ